MNEEIKEWIDKAEGDFAVALRDRARENPCSDAVCFHAQQFVSLSARNATQSGGACRLNPFWL